MTVRTYKKFLTLKWSGISFLMIAVVATTLATAFHTRPRLTPSATLYSSSPALTVISEADAARYRYIFNAQKGGDWRAANTKIAQLEDKLLLGEVLAQRYLSESYTANYKELHAWLAAYPNHRQSYDIFKLAVARHEKEDAQLIQVARRPYLSGYGDDNGLARLNSDPQLAEAASLLYGGNPHAAYVAASTSRLPSAHWIAGIAAWQLHDIDAAARHFATMVSARDAISPWQEAAAAFWAYRAYDAKGDARATRYLEIAASHPRTFYGVMANKALGHTLNVNSAPPPALTDSSLAALYANPEVKRAAAFVQAGQTEMAESELRTLFPTVDRNTRALLLSFAMAMDLPSVQIGMARALKKQGLSYDVALYPTPKWQPAGGFAVDPALIFAMARQESGFRTNAKSHTGALGLMQLMPQTASRMQTLAALSMSRENFFEPAANLALGQAYLTHLMHSTNANSNLIFLTASYNAGPGKLAEWTKTLNYGNDPLLFMESIPYAETRNYVSQVLTSYWIYREMNGKVATSALSLAEGSWPIYDETPPLALAPLTAAKTAG